MEERPSKHTSRVAEWHIYALRDPRTHEIRYVGCTRVLKKRFHQHLRIGASDRTHRAEWVRELAILNLRPLLEILETTSGDYQAAERKWISSCKADGHHLTNATHGGNGTAGYVFTEADRAKIAKAGRRKHSPEWIHNSAAAHRTLNRKLSSEHKEIVSQTHKGRCFLTPEQIEGIRQKLKHRNFTEEHRANLSAAGKGKAKSAETRAKLSVAIKGKIKHSAEARQKMRDAWAKRKAERPSSPEMERQPDPKQ
jgi:hypothetical protein